jgi:(p)ppGpp synthase/HD superfamily hydrolase
LTRNWLPAIVAALFSGFVMNPIFTIHGLQEFLVALDAVESSERARVLVALGLMMGLHADQGRRLTGEHYATHPLEVARVLIEDFGITNSDLIIVALLHDTLEDQLPKLVAMAKSPVGDHRLSAVEVLADLFNPFVAKGVLALSNPISEKVLSPEAKRQKYFCHIEELFQEAPEYALVKCADLACNACNLHLVEDIARKDKMQRKYLPVLHYIVEQLEQVHSGEHVLYPATVKFLPKIIGTLDGWSREVSAEGSQCSGVLYV